MEGCGFRQTDIKVKKDKEKRKGEIEEIMERKRKRGKMISCRPVQVAWAWEQTFRN